MLRHQREFWELPNYIKAMVGGYGSGKTHIGALRAIMLSRKNRGIPGMYVSPSFPTARKTIIITLKDILDRSGVRYRWREVEHSFEINSWGGIIWIGSGDNPDSLKGPNLGWAGIDEPFLQKREVFDQMIARVRHPQASSRELFLTGTPEQLNWGYDVCMNVEGKYDIGAVIAKSSDNHHLPRQTILAMEAAYTKEQREAYLEGRFVNLTSGRVYKDFDRNVHMVHGEYPSLPTMAGIDFNVDHLSAEIFKKGPNFAHFFDEFRMKNATTFDMANMLEAKYPGITVFPDPSGSARHTSASKSDHDILSHAGCIIRSHRKQPPVRERVNAMNKMFLDNRITVEPNTCPELVSDFERCVWKGGDIDKKSDPARTHASDAAGYAIEYLFPVRSRKVWTSER